MEETRRIPRYYSSSSSSFSTSSDSEMEELQRLENAPPFWRTPGKKRLSKQLSMCERPRDIAWEKRRRQNVQKERKNNKGENLTDEDLRELKGCIELGFGFKEKEGQMLCNTLPALDLYFAVNRQYCSPSTSPISTPDSRGSSVYSSPSCQLEDRSTSFGTSGEEQTNNNIWKICSPGDDPQQIKTKLRHWAQAVACSVLQSY